MFKVFEEIGFQEDVHKYTFETDKRITPLSVSGIIGQYKKPFDSDFFAGRKADSLGIDKQIILDQWKNAADIGCSKGTVSHLYLEDGINKVPFTYPKRYDYVKELFLALKPQMDRFLKENRLENVKTELIMGCKELGITGTLDQLFRDPRNGDYYIFDWKTNKKIERSSNYNFIGKLKELDSSELSTYSLQLSLYKYLLEKYTDIKIKASYIVWFNANNKSYEIIKTKNVDKYVNIILDDLAATKDSRLNKKQAFH